jgi:hypothetical protein
MIGETIDSETQRRPFDDLLQLIECRRPLSEREVSGRDLVLEKKRT